MSTIASGLQRVGLGELNQWAKLALRHRRIRVRADGFDIEGPATAFRLLRHLERGDYEPNVTRAYLACLKPGGRVLDIGAAVGYYTLLASRAVGGDGTVLAFEADPYAARSLRRNVDVNDATNVRVYERAVSDRPGDVIPFFVSTTTGHSAVSPPPGNRSTEVTVETITIDNLDLAPLDVVKIDAEGSELHVLRGMAATVAASPTLTMFMEFSPPALRRAGSDPLELLGFLSEWFDVRAVDPAEQPLLERIEDIPVRVDIVCARR